MLYKKKKKIHIILSQHTSDAPSPITHNEALATCFNYRFEFSKSSAKAALTTVNPRVFHTRIKKALLFYRSPVAPPV